MEQMQTPAFGEQEKMTDLLSSEKLLTGIYNTFCCEAATASVQSCLLSVLNDEHRIHEELFNEMSTRGWYPTEKAQEQQLNATKQKFSKTVSV